MKRIVVPIDFSPYSEHAFLSAVKIASKGDASITCVNAVNAALDWKNMSETDKRKHQDILDMEAEAKDKLNAFVKDHNIKNNPVEAVVEVGVPFQVLVDIAHKQMADLIVIGAYGKGHEPGKFIGSTSQKVMRHAKCPVLAVKKLVDGRAMKKMVFASLFNEDSRPAFTRMKPLIKRLGASVHYVFVNTPSKFTDSEQAESKMKSYASGNEDLVIHRHVYSHDEAEKGIVAFAENQKAGIIGIASSTRTSNSSYQIGVTDTVLFKTDIPVLSVKFD